MDTNTGKSEEIKDNTNNIETENNNVENREINKNMENSSNEGILNHEAMHNNRREFRSDNNINDIHGDMMMQSSRINNILNHQPINSYNNIHSSNNIHSIEMDYPEQYSSYRGAEFLDANNTISIDEVLNFIEELRKNVNSNPAIYDSFLENMRDYKLRKIDSYELIESINSLLLNYPELLIKFKRFCPREYDARYNQNFDRRTYNNTYLQSINKPNSPIMQSYTNQQVNIQNSIPFHSQQQQIPQKQEVNRNFSNPINNSIKISHQNNSIRDDPKMELHSYATNFLNSIKSQMTINHYDKFCKELIQYKNCIENNEDGEKHAFALQRILQNNDSLLEKFYGFLPQPEIDNLLNNICVCGNCQKRNSDLKSIKELEVGDMKGISNTDYVSKQLNKVDNLSNKPCLLLLKLLNMYTQNRCTSNELILFAKPFIGEEINQLEKYFERFNYLNNEKQINFIKIVGSYRILETPKNMRFPLNNEAILCSSLTSEEFITLSRTLSRDTIYRTEDEIHSVHLLISRLEMCIEYLVSFNQKLLINSKINKLTYFMKSIIKYLYGNSNAIKIIDLYNKLISKILNEEVNREDEEEEDNTNTIKEVLNSSKRIKKSRNPKKVLRSLNEIILNRFEYILRKWYLEMEMKNNLWSEVLQKENIEFTKVNNFKLETIITNNHTNHGIHYLGNTEIISINNSLIRRRNKYITPYFTTQIYYHCCSKELMFKYLKEDNSENINKLEFIFKIYNEILITETEKIFYITKNVAIFLKELFSFNKCLTEIKFFDLKVIEGNKLSYTPNSEKLTNLMKKLYEIGNPDTSLNVKEELKNISILTGNSCYSIMNLRTVLKSFKDQIESFDEMDFEEGDYDLKLFLKSSSDFDKLGCQCKNCLNSSLNISKYSKFVSLKSEEMLSI